MKVYLRSDSVTIEGYVNAVERNSKPLNERGVWFIERIAAGCFKKAIERAKDVRIWLNHKENRDLGGLSDGNLELEEDNIGLKARAVITDSEVIEQARKGNLIGWSFGFDDIPEAVTQLRDEESGLPLRKVNDLILKEVSILTRDKSPAYAGTLVNVRDDGSEETARINYGEDYQEEIEMVDESENTRAEDTPEAADAPKEEPAKEEPEKVTVSSEYFARYKNMINGWRL